MSILIFIAAIAPGGACQADAECVRGWVCETNVCAQLAAPATSPSLPPRALVPPGMHVESRAKQGLVIAGAVVLAAGWLWSWTSSAALCNTCRSGVIPASIVPVLGPFIEASLIDSSLIPFVIADGLVQAVGAGLVIAGLVTRHEVLVYDFGSLHGTFAPLPSTHGAGIAAVGHF